MYLNRLSLDVFILDYEASLGEKNSVSKVILQTCAFYIQLLLQCSISE